MARPGEEAEGAGLRVTLGLLAASLLLAGCAGLSGLGPSTSVTTTPPASSSTLPRSTSSSSSTASSSVTTTTASPVTTTITTTSPVTTTTTSPRPAQPSLSYGDVGTRVLALQRRLTSLGYWLGTANGFFGDSTQQAVYALQKAAGLTRDGVVGPQTEAALRRGVVPIPRPAKGYLVEIDLHDDVLMIVDNGKLLAALNTSTGGGYTYVDNGVSAVAETPVGFFRIFAAVDGMVVDSLGALWRPRYFDEGFAIHGDSYVPPEPVSHGCVRVSDEAIDWIWADDVLPIGTRVWVY